jgi:rhodanese-related sulfurtransferase
MEEMMRRLVAAVLFVLSIATAASAANYVKPEELKAWLGSGRPIIIVDIQPADAFSAQHFKGSIETNAFPVKSEEDRKKLEKVLLRIQASKDDIVIVCPRGKSGASNTYDYLKSRGVAETRLLILDGGIAGWPYKDMLEKGR